MTFNQIVELKRVTVKVNGKETASLYSSYSCWEDALSIWDPFFNIKPKHVTR